MSRGPENPAWELARLTEALSLLARAGGLAPHPVRVPEPSGDAPAVLQAWMSSSAQILGFEAERVEVPYVDLERYLAATPLLIVPVPSQGGTRFLAVEKNGKAITPTFTRQKLGVRTIRRMACAQMEDEALEGLQPVLGELGLRGIRLARARRALLAERLAHRRITVWFLRQPVTLSWRQLLTKPRWTFGAFALMGAHVLRIALWLLAWWLIASTALSGRLDRGWLTAWGLLLLTVTALHVSTVWLQARLAIGFGALLKQRLLAGALQMEPELLMASGAGQLLGRVLETDAVETLALSGGFAGAVALIELLAGVAILFTGQAWWTAGLLSVWMVITAWLAWRYFERGREWTRSRMDMTNNLVERMVGHRTRLAQESPVHWHEAEDRELSSYLAVSQSRDSAEAALAAVIPRGWLILGIASLAPLFLGQGTDDPRFAVAMGGLLVAYQAFRRLAAAAWQMIDARVAGEQVAPLLACVSQTEPQGSPAHASAPIPPSGVDAQEILFRYPASTEPVLRHCSLRLAPGDRAVLLGASGGGKSTLAGVLAGLRNPQGGLLLAGGLDRPTLGAQGWRRRVVLAPQYHQNHLITAPLAFNLLLGRPGPLSAADEQECRDVCIELGLGPLLEKMPAGLQQIVGETGWQLSQGERSRVFLARALLQKAQVVILDESFGALDPETLQLTVECVKKRASSLLVIAHP